VEGGDVDDVVEGAAGGLQHGLEIVEGQLHLGGEVRFGRAILAAADLARDEQQVARADRRRISVHFVQGPAAGGENCIAFGHVALLYRRVDIRAVCRHIYTYVTYVN
jgi:hypothetical protein